MIGRALRGSSIAGGLILAAALVLGGCGKERRAAPVVVIGLDGATWDLLQPWIDRGDLPTLAGFQRDGAWGEIQSSIPYLSPPAWTTAVTGVNPGKHAVFDFQRRLPGQPVIVNETAKSRRAQPIWNVLGKRERRSLLLNIPMTDPPDEVLGLCVAGFPHPDGVGFAYPQALEQKLADYPLDRLEMKLPPGAEDSLLAVYAEGREARLAIAREWLREEPFDFLWMVFTGTDRIQHTFWMFVDPENPNYDPARARRYGTAIHDFWVEQDRALGELLEEVPEDATVVIVSDHGFGPLRWDLKLRNYLCSPESGLTREEADGVYVLDRGDAARIFIARRGRDPGAIWPPAIAEGVRAKVVAALRAAHDPRTGEAVCEAVWTNEEVFSGNYAEKGPDIVALPARGYFLVWGDEEPDPDAPWLTAHGAYLSGWHRMNGLYAMRGQGISPGRRNGDGQRPYSLTDVMPTLLYLCGEPIPEGLDGLLMESVIDPALLQERPPESAPALEEDIREMSPEELRNLKNLPYIGG